MNPYNVLKKPLLSEKSNAMREEQNKYAFLIDRKATKLDVKKAIELAFDVNVVSVRTCITRGKYKRRGMRIALGSSSKKAVVTLSEGQSLSLFEDK